jgi:hypothetical protein
MPSRRSLPLVLALALSLAAPVALAAQAGPGGQDEFPGPWAPPQIGVRGGYDNQQRRWVLGGQLRLPVVPQGQVELMPSVDVTFARGLKEYQYNLELVYVLDGRSGGIYGGGGVGWRNTVFNEDPTDPTVLRETHAGFTAVLGIRIVELGVVVPQIEYRGVFIGAAPVNYQQLTLGVNLALWRPVRRAR